MTDLLQVVFKLLKEESDKKIRSSLTFGEKRRTVGPQKGLQLKNGSSNPGKILEKVPTSCSQISMKFYTDVAKYISRLNLESYRDWMNRF